jgi:hypothetical protein
MSKTQGVAAECRHKIAAMLSRYFGNQLHELTMRVVWNGGRAVESSLLRLGRVISALRLNGEEKHQEFWNEDGAAFP